MLIVTVPLSFCMFSKLPAKQRHHYEVIPEGPFAI